MKLKAFLFLLFNFCCMSNGEGASVIKQPVGKYPCDNNILFGFENSASVDPVVFERQLNFLANRVFERWNQFGHLSTFRYGDFEHNYFFGSITEVKKYIESTKQVESNNTICDVFSRLSFPITNTRIILFVNEFSVSDIEDDCALYLRELISRGNQIAFIPLSDKFNQTVLKHYFNQATIIQWDVVNDETPKDWEKQFNAFYNCDQTVTTVGKPTTTPKNPLNSYPPCNTSPITIAFDKSNGLTDVEFQQQKDFLINHVFQKWTKFDRLRVFSFADHVYSDVISPKNITELTNFIQAEEQVEEKPDLCNFFETCVVNYDNENNHFVVFLSKLEGTDIEKRDPKSSVICERFIDDVFKSIQLTFVLLHDRIDPDVLRRHIPTAQFIKMNLPDPPASWEWQFLTAYGCNKDNANDQTSYPCDKKLIIAYEVSSGVDSDVLEIQRKFLLNQVFVSEWNVFNNLALVAYSSEISVQDFGTIDKLDDVHRFIENSMGQFSKAPASLCFLFKKLTTMYIRDVNIVLFASKFHEQTGDDCQVWIKQLRDNTNYINVVNLTRHVNVQYLLERLPQATFTSWNIKQNGLPDTWGRTSFGGQDFLVDAKEYPCDSGRSRNNIIYDRSDFLTPFAYQRLANFLTTNVFIEQWSSEFTVYTYPDVDFTNTFTRVDVEFFIHGNLQSRKEPLICQVLKYLGAFTSYANFIFFVSKFDESTFVIDDICKESVERINSRSNSITFISLTRLVNLTFIKQLFPRATIIDWDIEDEEELKNWGQILWESFGCAGKSPIIYPHLSSSTLSPTTKFLTSTLMSTTSLASTKMTTTTRTKTSKRNTLTFTPRMLTTRSSPSNAAMSDETAILLGVFISILVILLIAFGVLIWCYRKVNQQAANMKPIQLRDNEYTAERQRDPWELPQEYLRIDFIEKLGSGAFGDVFIGKLLGDAPIKNIFADSQYCQKFHNCDIAVKTLPRMQVDEYSRKEFKKEIDFMKKLKFHANLVCFLGYVEDPTNPLLLLEYCANGDLLRFLRLNKHKFVDNFEGQTGADCKTLVSFAWQVSSGLEYLNSLNLIHRDVAARNILLDKNNTCKLSDFGLCRLAQNLNYQSKRGKLPIRWMAIEAIKDHVYTTKTDVWSYGVLLYEIFSLGDLPYLNVENIVTYIESGKRLEKPEYCSDKVHKLMLACWKVEPEKRPRFISICQFMEKLFETATLYYNYVDASTEQSDEV